LSYQKIPLLKPLCRKLAQEHGFIYLAFLSISSFAQTSIAHIFINPSFSAILVISRTQVAQASIDGYVQGFPETTFLKPIPLPSEISHTLNALSLWHRF
jgi:hypothetical protein